MINTQIRHFRDSIIGLTNACELPIEIKRLVFAEIQHQINVECDRVIIAEKEQKEKEEKGNE